MKHVDALSRAPVEQANEELEEAWIFNTMISNNEILMYQRSDELLAIVEREGKLKVMF